MTCMYPPPHITCIYPPPNGMRAKDTHAHANARTHTHVRARTHTRRTSRAAGPSKEWFSLVK
jgi:hypothetical protein